MSRVASTVAQTELLWAEHWAAKKVVNSVDTMDGPKAAGTVVCSAVLSAATMAACWVVDWAVQMVALTDSS